jgi:hypothetical protein
MAVYALERRRSGERNSPKVLQAGGTGAVLLWHDPDRVERFALHLATQRGFDKTMALGWAIVEADDILEENEREWVLMDMKPIENVQAVRVFEDAVRRRYAIETRCNGEQDFVDNIATELTSDPAMQQKLRGFLPLIVDVCSKYRGYKADTVLERKVLITGDLDLPNDQSS